MPCRGLFTFPFNSYKYFIVQSRNLSAGRLSPPMSRPSRDLVLTGCRVTDPSFQPTRGREPGDPRPIERGRAHYRGFPANFQLSNRFRDLYCVFSIQSIYKFQFYILYLNKCLDSLTVLRNENK